VKKLGLLFICLFSYGISFCVNSNLTEITTRIKSSDKKTQVAGLIDLAVYYAVVQEDSKACDSILDIAVETAKSANNKELLLSTYISFIKYNQAQNSSVITQQLLLANKIIADNKLNYFEFKLKLAEAHYLKHSGKPADAINVLVQAKPLAEKNSIDNLLYYFTLGSYYSDAEEKSNAYIFLSNALKLSIQNEQDSITYLCHLELYEYYAKNKFLDKSLIAVENLKTLVAEKKFDAYDVMAVSKPELTIHALRKNPDILKKGKQIIDDAMAKNYKSIATETFSTLRSHFITSEDYKGICDLYCTKTYEPYYLELKETKPSVYYRIKAYIYENNKQLDSADMYWNVARASTSSNNKAFLSAYFSSYGNYCLRRNNIDQAIMQFDSAFYFAKLSNYLPFILKAAQMQDSLYRTKGDYKTAYQWLQESKKYTDSTYAYLNNDMLSAIEYNTNKEIEEINTAKELHRQELNHDLQVYGILALIVILLYLLLVFSGRNISVGTIKFCGYMLVVFVFEFFIFLMHKLFHAWVHAPFFLILMNVALIATLLPIHHALEHKFIHYLNKRNLLHKKDINFTGSIKAIIKQVRSWLKVGD
jgi:hypothetical protein